MSSSARHAAANPGLTEMLAGMSPVERFQMIFCGQPVPVDRANLEDAQRTAARLADIELGLKSPEDALFWRSIAEMRLKLLAIDAEHYGLVPHEEAEAAKLRELLA